MVLVELLVVEAAEVVEVEEEMVEVVAAACGCSPCVCVAVAGRQAGRQVGGR